MSVHWRRARHWRTGLISTQKAGFSKRTSLQPVQTAAREKRSWHPNSQKNRRRNLGSCHTSSHPENRFILGKSFEVASAAAAAFVAAGFTPGATAATEAADASGAPPGGEAAFVDEESAASFPEAAAAPAATAAAAAFSAAVGGTLGVLTGRRGELVRLLEDEKNLSGFSAAAGAVTVDPPSLPAPFDGVDAASNFALPLATAPVIL